MADFRISRIRYTWRGEWANARDYNKDDVIKFGGSSWVCIRQHTSTAFNDDLTYIPPGDTIAQPAWIKMTDGYKWRDAWESGTLYSPGDLVLFGGTVYIALTSHTANSFNSETVYWGVYAQSSSWKGTWSQSTTYGPNDIVRLNGTVYRCVVGHDSGSFFDTDSNKWQIVYSGIAYRGGYTPTARYAINDLVKYGGTIFRCTTEHTAPITFDDTKFSVEFYGNEFGGEWASSTVYQIGDVVKHGGYLYYANANNTAKNPPSSSEWNILSKGVNARGVWNATTDYKTGDVVERGGYLYVAVSDIVSDGSTQDYLDTGDWELVVPGQAWKNSWDENVTYGIGDVVILQGAAYRANFGHISNSENYPGDNGNGYDYWDLLIQADVDTALSTAGDILSYGEKRWRTGDGSTFGTRDIPIGSQDQLLVVESDDDPGYKTWGDQTRFFYVATDGLDDDTDSSRGVNPFKPWRTVNYALDKADDGYSGTTTVYVQAGRFEEVCPMVVPARTAVRGHEERATTILASGPDLTLADDVGPQLNAISRMSSLMPALLAGNTASLSAGNDVEQTILTRDVITVQPDPVNPDQSIEVVTQVPITASDALDTVLDQVAVLSHYINHNINGADTQPTLSGSNTATTDNDILTAIDIITANKDLIVAEGIAFTRVNTPSYSFDETFYRNLFRRYVDSWIYDLTYTGTYKTIRSGKFYVNKVQGSTRKDMFYVRDATGIRQLTVDGLTGDLTPPDAFELYQRPTGGAYVSLDPGWGPADETAWITTRSPYIQGLATFGERCIGQKIDGALHNGGNKSIVSNDFTQVISDGVGAWVENNGRAELVSVFTYYAQVGYLASNGGIIRATNGNNSYGNYGAYAIGFDATEATRTATVDNRNQHAQINNAFAGEVNDEILIYEFDHAGSGYTQATSTFLGAGVNAQVDHDEFRDGGVSNTRIINVIDSSTPGGGGYTQIGNNAQAGNTLTITLASNDDNSPDQLIGARLILTSGTGTGQYGYIQAYDEVSKLATIYRESDDQPGWDHVIPGWPVATTLDTSSTYRIEPRVTFSHPGFTASTINLGAQTQWANIAYGETTSTYTNIPSQLGTGIVDGRDGLVPVVATFNITRVGREYTVTINNDGAGYNDEDVLTIPGTSVGGISPDNDIRITVTGTTLDSTNSITTFSYEGYGASGVFVATAELGRTTSYSADGETWTAVGEGMPTSGNWKCLASGSGRFVALRRHTSTGEAGNGAAYSTDGVSWTSASVAKYSWNDVTYGDGLFVAVSDGEVGPDQYTYSTDGVTWQRDNMPNLGDSTTADWESITYGKGKFVAVASSGNLSAIGTYNSGTDSIDWNINIMDVISDSSQKDWISVEWGNNRFVAVSRQGDVAYSFDGEIWYPASMPKPDGSTIMDWNSVKYGQGVFFAVCDTGGRAIAADATSGPTTYCATSYDGIVWTNRDLASSRNWTNVAFGNPDISVGDSTPQRNTGTWIAISNEIDFVANKIYTGARALGRVSVTAGRISAVKMWEPGSGYSVNPTLTLTDPNNTTDAQFEPRVDYQVLAQPSWINRGTGYRTSSTTVTISGDGFAEIVQQGNQLTLDNLSRYPSPGTQLVVDGISDITYTTVTVTELGENDDGTFRAQLRIDPTWDANEGYVAEHGTTVNLRERYSQCRITGHDFLDVGTGNFTETNYPALYAGGAYIVPNPENEVYEANGGRVFYTATDQDGNFRAGELFAVEQSTGIVTISADFFDLEGLAELRLGGIRVGGSGTVVREFSTDALFTEDSNNVVPTQKAIAAYLANRLSVGGSELTTASFIAGTVKVGADEIRSTIGGTVDIGSATLFEAGGTPLENDDGTGQGQVQGAILGQTLFHASFADDAGRIS